MCPPAASGVLVTVAWVPISPLNGSRPWREFGRWRGVPSFRELNVSLAPLTSPARVLKSKRSCRFQRASRFISRNRNDFCPGTPKDKHRRRTINRPLYDRRCQLSRIIPRKHFSIWRKFVSPIALDVTLDGRAMEDA